MSTNRGCRCNFSWSYTPISAWAWRLTIRMTIGSGFRMVDWGEQVFAGDKTRAPFAGEVVRGPLEKYEHFVVKSDQIHDVDENPEEPSKKTTETREPEISHGGIAADHGEAA